MIRNNFSQLSDHNESFSSMGKSSIHWSFSKARRFKHNSLINCPNLLDLPSTLEKRTTTFGFGRRYELINTTGKDAPSADKYNIPSSFDSDKRGPVMAGSSRDQPRKTRPSTPGPGTYELGTTICKDGPKFSFRARFQTKEKFKSPPPGTYNPRYSLKDKHNYSDITFGIGPRGKEGKTRPSTPGPGTYEVPSCFTKINGQGTANISPPKTKVFKNN